MCILFVFDALCHFQQRASACSMPLRDQRHMKSCLHETLSRNSYTQTSTQTQCPMTLAHCQSYTVPNPMTPRHRQSQRGMLEKEHGKPVQSKTHEIMPLCDSITQRSTRTCMGTPSSSEAHAHACICFTPGRPGFLAPVIPVIAEFIVPPLTSR